MGGWIRRLLDDNQHFLVDECWENRGKLKWNLRPLHVHFKNKRWSRDKLRLFMNDFRKSVQSYGIAVPPEEDSPYSSTTVGLLAFYFNEAELARLPGKSEELIESLTSMIRKATCCHMESNCTLEVILGTTFVVHDGGTTSGLIANGLHWTIMNVFLTMWSEMYRERLLDSPANDGLSGATVTDIVKFFVLILRVRRRRRRFFFTTLAKRYQGRTTQVVELALGPRRPLRHPNFCDMRRRGGAMQIPAVAAAPMQQWSHIHHCV